tara:strand:- start:274 stop:408 length:135 start_codon:yes stop_codon:yes gene_type:complete
MELFSNPQTQIIIGLIIGMVGAYSAGYMHGLETGEAKQKNNDKR